MHPLVNFRPPMEFAACATVADVAPAETVAPSPTSSHEVSPPTAFSRPGQRHVGRVCLTRPPAPTGFLNLLTPWSAPRLVALFHATSAHGVLPSESFSSRAAVRRLRRHYPLVVGSVFLSPRSPTCMSRAPKCRASSASPHVGANIQPTLAFRALLHTRIRHSTPVV